LLEESSGELLLVFPARLKDYAAAKTNMIGKEYYTPAKPVDWIGLDQVQGTLKVHIFASKNRLEKLESLLGKYLELVKGKQEDSDDAKEARQKVVEEMKRIRLENASAKTVKTGPVPVAGNFREKEGKLEFDAIVVEAESFYAKTVRIDH
jgi:hypothetical protein